MKKLLISLATFATMFGSLSGVSMAAGSANFILNPASGTENITSIFSVGIYENGDQVNVVTADLTYDTSQLQFISIDVSASAFPNQVTGSGGSGSVDISRYNAPGNTVSGTQEVAAITFKVLGGSGVTSVSVAGSSKIASNGSDIWSHAATSANYTLNTPAPTPTPTPTPTPSNGSQNSHSDSSTPKTTNTSSSTNTNPPTPAGSTLGSTTQVPASHSGKSTDSHKMVHKPTPKSHRASATLAYSTLILILAVVAISWAWIMRARKPLPALFGKYSIKKKSARKSSKK
jgi:hypothetical protein